MTSPNNKRNRTIGYLAFLAFSLLSATASAAEVSDVIEKSYPFDKNGRVSLSNVNGDVTIKACDCSEVSVKATIKASSQEVRDRISVEIENPSSSRLSIRTRYKKNQGSSWHNQHSEVIYELAVPTNAQLDEIELVNGDLAISRVAGPLDVSLVNGSLKSDGRNSSAKVEMVNGDIELKFDSLDNTKRVNLDSVNGDIVIYLPADASARIDAETVSGSISNDFGIEVIKHRYVGREMRGTLGSGEAEIDLENVNGSIEVKQH